MTTLIHTPGWTQESIQKMVEGLTIHNLVWYVDPSSIHLFLSPNPLRYDPCSILVIAAEDDGSLTVKLHGPDVPESPNDRA